MKNRLTSSGRLQLLLLVCALQQSAVTVGQQESARPAFQQYAQQTALSYRLRTAGPKPQDLAMEPQSLLRWSNQLTGKQTAGEVFLWTDQGRPQAVMSLYRFTDNQNILREQHEFCSLSLAPLVAKRGPGEPWTPSSPGVEWKPIPEGKEPAASRSRRLLEMRQLATLFTADKTTRDNVVRPLRLLPQPVYRFDGQHPEVIDGGVFAFVEETDPEILLLIEAQKTGDSAKWMYVAVRMNSIRLHISHQQQPIWEAPLLSWGEVLDQPTLPYTVLKVPDPMIPPADPIPDTVKPPKQE